MLLEPVNLLILDEPTNHLDMRTKDVLKDAIRDFNGTVIVVSHDREFLDGLVEKVYEFGGGRVREHLGGIYDFLETKKIESLRELEMTQSKSTEKQPQLSKSPTVAANAEAEQPKQGRRSYEEQKARERLIRKAQKSVAESEKTIADIEAEIAEIEQKLSSGEAVDPDIYQRHSDLQKKLENAMSVWELACMELEEISNS